MGMVVAESTDLPRSGLRTPQGRPALARTAALQNRRAGSRPGTVFSINFIRGQSLSLRLRRRVVTFLISVVAVNLLVLAGLLIAGAGLSREGRALERQSAAPAGHAGQAGIEMSALVRDANASLAELRAIAAAQRERFLVGGRVAAIVKTLPAGTWITQLHGERKARSIDIAAVYLIDPAAPQLLPAKAWIDTLKADPVFSQGLKRLELGTTTRKRQDDAELYSFGLTVEWEPPTAK